eukprot:3356251-Pyramimonas_sp.AAC.1
MNGGIPTNDANPFAHRFVSDTACLSILTDMEDWMDILGRSLTRLFEGACDKHRSLYTDVGAFRKLYQFGAMGPGIDLGEFPDEEEEVWGMAELRYNCTCLNEDGTL